eukprot:14797575-Ditylum_brightwellii.AAC.1
MSGIFAGHVIITKCSLTVAEVIALHRRYVKCAFRMCTVDDAYISDKDYHSEWICWHYFSTMKLAWRSRLSRRSASS